MAKTSYASLCVLLVLATAQCVLGQVFLGTPFTAVYNNASFDIGRWKELKHSDGRLTIIDTATLAHGKVEEFTIPRDVICVRTWYRQLNTDLGQVLLDWCETDMPVDCVPYCYWEIDDKGFSVTNAAIGFHNPRAVAVWEPILQPQPVPGPVSS